MQRRQVPPTTYTMEEMLLYCTGDMHCDVVRASLRYYCCTENLPWYGNIIRMHNSPALVYSCSKTARRVLFLCALLIGPVTSTTINIIVIGGNDARPQYLQK